ncbi:MAG TPA: DUF1801 domain-containing protein [Acidimicrobiia bacterium]|nr:DUF1801 domain-containing protein [Acidimicrobiia bacterium]
MAELKTKKHDGDVDAFLAGIEDEAKREDARELRQMMAEVTGDDGAMWGDSIVGFGSYHYRYASGREGDWFEVGFSPRKRNLTVYLVSGFRDRDGLLPRLGKHTTGKACLYLRRLSDVDRDVLRQLVEASVDQTRAS